MNEMAFIGGWGDTRAEERFMLEDLQTRVRHMGVTPKIIARHTLAVDRRDAPKFAASEYQRRKRAQDRIKKGRRSATVPTVPLAPSPRVARAEQGSAMALPARTSRRDVPTC